jgi:hypothetical protein
MSPKKSLVVDDDPDVRLALQVRLSSSLCRFTFWKGPVSSSVAS